MRGPAQACQSSESRSSSLPAQKPKGDVQRERERESTERLLQCGYIHTYLECQRSKNRTRREEEQDTETLEVRHCVVARPLWHCHCLTSSSSQQWQQHLTDTVKLRSNSTYSGNLPLFKTYMFYVTGTTSKQKSTCKNHKILFYPNSSVQCSSKQEASVPAIIPFLPATKKQACKIQFSSRSSMPVSKPPTLA